MNARFPSDSRGGIWQLAGSHATLSPFGGGIAQLVERVVRNDEAWGSNPHTSIS